MCEIPSSIGEDSVATKLKKLESGVIGVLTVVQAQLHWSTLRDRAADTIVSRPLPWPGPRPINPAADKCHAFLPFMSWDPARDTITINDSLALTREWLNKLIDVCDEITVDLPGLP